MAHFEFEINAADNNIELYLHDLQNPVHVNMEKFYGWVKQNGLADFCIDFEDARERDKHGQRTGRLTMQEYFDLSTERIEKDLKQYYITKILKETEAW